MKQFTQQESLTLATIVKEAYLPKLKEDIKNTSDDNVKNLLLQRCREIEVITDKIEEVGDFLLV